MKHQSAQSIPHYWMTLYSLELINSIQYTVYIFKPVLYTKTLYFLLLCTVVLFKTYVITGSVNCIKNCFNLIMNPICSVMKSTLFMHTCKFRYAYNPPTSSSISSASFFYVIPHISSLISSVLSWWNARAGESQICTVMHYHKGKVQHRNSATHICCCGVKRAQHGALEGRHHKSC